MPKDYYKILEVDRNASGEDVKKAYRRLAHKYHPDKAGGDEQKFKEINEAYQILSSKEGRSQYDRFGHIFSGEGGPARGEGPFAGFDFGGFGSDSGFDFGESRSGDFSNLSDIFNAFFEGLGVKKKRAYRRGSDLEFIQEIVLEEAFRGTDKEIEFEVFDRCQNCGGLGYFQKEGLTTCSMCGGQGDIRESRTSFFGAFSQVRPCKKCFGSGQIPNKICSICSGSGRVKSRRKMSVNIVPGINDDQLIKISKAGEAGERGADVGDLYIRIKVKPHSIFERRNDDLIIKKELSILDILLGNRAQIKTISGGQLNIEIPTGFNFKEKLRISGEGMPRFNRFGRGDLLVELEIRSPKKLNSRVKKILEDLKKELEDS